MMCSGRISLQPARSAMVRESLIIRVHARAESPIFSMIRCRSPEHSGLRGQYFAICRLFMAALQKMPSSSANLSR